MSVKVLLLWLLQTPWTQALNDIYLQTVWRRNSWDMRGTDLELLVLASKVHPGPLSHRGSRADKPGSIVLWKGPLELVGGMWRGRWALPFVPLSQWLVPLSWRCWGPVVVASRLLLPVHQCGAVSKFSNRVRGVNGGLNGVKRRLNPVRFLHSSCGHDVLFSPAPWSSCGRVHQPCRAT